jgi:hypothetical protein
MKEDDMNAMDVTLLFQDKEGKPPAGGAKPEPERPAEAGKPKTEQPADEEKRWEGRYYASDGALRAYANRAMILAFVSAFTAMGAVAFAAYVRLQPATVIRVDAAGRATVADGKPDAANSNGQADNTAPTDLEKRAYVRLFLDRYMNFSPASVNRTWAESLNMMTGNLRSATLAAMRNDNTVGKIQDEQITSVFQFRGIEPVKDDPLSFTAFGVMEIHRVHDHAETTDKLVGEFHVRLIAEKRSEQNPSGLLIAEYGERLIEGERPDADRSK